MCSVQPVHGRTRHTANGWLDVRSTLGCLSLELGDPGHAHHSLAPATMAAVQLPPNVQDEVYPVAHNPVAQRLP